MASDAGRLARAPDSPIDELHEALEGRRVDADASFGAAFPYPKATYSKRKPRLVRDDEDGEARAADDTSRRVVGPHPRLAAL